MQYSVGDDAAGRKNKIIHVNFSFARYTFTCTMEDLYRLDPIGNNVM